MPDKNKNKAEILTEEDISTMDELEEYLPDYAEADFELYERMDISDEEYD